MRYYELRMAQKPSKTLPDFIKEDPEYMKKHYSGTWTTLHTSYKEARNLAKMVRSFGNKCDFEVTYPHFSIKKVYGESFLDEFYRNWRKNRGKFAEIIEKEKEK